MEGIYPMTGFTVGDSPCREILQLVVICLYFILVILGLTFKRILLEILSGRRRKTASSLRKFFDRPKAWALTHCLSGAACLPLPNHMALQAIFNLRHSSGICCRLIVIRGE